MTHSFHVNPKTGRTGLCNSNIKCSYRNNTDNDYSHHETLKDALIYAERIKSKTLGHSKRISVDSLQCKVALCSLVNIATNYLDDSGLDVMESHSGMLLRSMLSGNVQHLRSTVSLVIYDLKQINDASNSIAVADVEEGLNHISDSLNKIDGFKVSEVYDNDKIAGSVRKLLDANDLLDSAGYRLFSYHAYWVLRSLLSDDDQKLISEILSFKKGLTLHKTQWGDQSSQKEYNSLLKRI